MLQQYLLLFQDVEFDLYQLEQIPHHKVKYQQPLKLGM